MNQTSEWICRLSSLREITRVEGVTITEMSDELDGIQYENGAEYAAIQSDLQSLIDCYCH
jgi:hypothetical protein